MYKKHRFLFGQLAQYANLLEGITDENVKHLSKYTGSIAVILRGTDDLIMSGGRTLLAKI